VEEKSNPKSMAIIGGIVAVVVIIGVVAAIMMHHPTTTASTQTSSSPQANPSQSGSPVASSVATAAAATITYGSGGFSPALTTVKSGQSVTFKNTSSQEVQVDSNPHPVHTDDTDLNVGSITPGQSKTVTLTKTGNFGFHNHLNPGETARIAIQ
jgi:plastocyanin